MCTSSGYNQPFPRWNVLKCLWNRGFPLLWHYFYGNYFSTIRPSLWRSPRPWSRVPHSISTNRREPDSLTVLIGKDQLTHIFHAHKWWQWGLLLHSARRSRITLTFSFERVQIYVLAWIGNCGSILGNWVVIHICGNEYELWDESLFGGRSASCVV